MTVVDLDPTTELEEAVFANGARYVAGVDEVGRGAWAGPVSVGVVVVDRWALGALPAGIRDSKLLAPERRVALFPAIARAVTAYAIGSATHAECDEHGMTEAQRLAAARAFRAIATEPDVVIVDGKFEYTRHPAARPVIGADRSSVVVAAASVLAKVTRDGYMRALAHRYPAYAFASNKGYPSPVHRAALGSLGLTDIHRRSWAFVERLTGCGADQGRL